MKGCAHSARAIRKSALEALTAVYTALLQMRSLRTQENGQICASTICPFSTFWLDFCAKIRANCKKML